MLSNARVAARVPCQDLERARRFYSEVLGLEPDDARPGGYLYRFANGEFALFESEGVSPGTFTQMGFEVDDLDAVVASLDAHGIERWDVADIEGHYPSKGYSGERATWFRDSEGNLLGVGEPVA